MSTAFTPNRVFAALVSWAGIAGILGTAFSSSAEEKSSSAGATPSQVVLLGDLKRQWLIKIDPQEGINHFGLDSEGTDREKVNLLAAPIGLIWAGAGGPATPWQRSNPWTWTSVVPGKETGESLTWSIASDREELVWTFQYQGEKSGGEFGVSLPFNPLMGAAVLIPAKLDSQSRGLGPWLLVVPDFGHLRVEAEPAAGWHVINTGRRGSGQNAPKSGVDPRLRGQAWLQAVSIPNYHPGRLTLQFAHPEPLSPGTHLTLRFSPQELTTPGGVPSFVWKRIRRPFLNNWQPCGTWTDPAATWVLANNVLSDPASCSLVFYADPMLFYREPVPGINLQPLLRYSLDYWLHNHVSAQGHVNAFGKMYDLYPSCGAFVINAAWDYWTISKDTEWLRREITVLHRMADYLARRDVDNDGLFESYGSGNAGTLRDPDRADVWFEMTNFGHKNAWANANIYRAYCCMADMLDALEQKNGAAHYRALAARLRDAYVRQLLSRKNGWFVGWISQDGKAHDYCYTFVNGAAVAYGIVGPEQGRKILSRVVAKSKSIGFNQWHLGVPGNLIPCCKEDMIGPAIGLDGEPVHDDFAWPDPPRSDEELFGYRYTDGTIHPPLVWPYLLGLQVAGLGGEADRILNAMITSAMEGLFQNGIVNVGYGGAEHFYINGRTCGYEGYLPESFNFLMAAFTREPAARERLLAPMHRLGVELGGPGGF